MKVKDVARLAIVASLYVALTLALGFIAYGDIQFRVAEILVLLCFFRKDYSISLIVGCLIANIFSPMGIVDVVFGTTATVFSVLLVMISKNIFVSAIYPVLFNGVIVGAELYFVLELPFIPSAVSVAIGEACVLLVGSIVFYFLSKNEKFLELIKANQNIPNLKKENE